MNRRLASLFVALPALALAQNAIQLPEVAVYSPRVANQSPAGTFAMPVSALRYEPRVDIQGRNLAEGQADITLRGGVFENTGFQVGAVTVPDPQTGHYFAEIPIAPSMLGAPEIKTGVELALGAVNATTGAVAYGWREIRTAGALAIAAGEHGFLRGELYQGYAGGLEVGGARLAADFAVGYSKSDGAIPFGEHEFNRVNGRLQLVRGASRTDFFAGYQAKFFGWPNLYTPFNSNETEDLETVLFAINHREDLGAGDFVEAGLFHRRNKDDYAFNRFAPVGPVHPFQHTTWVTGFAAGGRKNLGPVILNFRGERLDDDLKSTSLTFGRYRTRTLTKLALFPEKSWALADGAVTLKAGATFDDSDREGSELSPGAEIAREFASSPLRRIHVGFTRATQVATYTALNSSAGAGLFRGNPDLRRATADSLELGVAGTLAGWTGQAAAFWRHDDGLVDWTFRRGVTARSANPVDIDVTGFEAVGRRSWSAVDLVLGYTWLDKDADYRSASVDASFYALNYARHRLTAAATVRLGRGFELRVDNVLRFQAENLLRVAGGDHALSTSVGLAYRPAGLRQLEISLQVDNAWDEDFQEVPAVPASPRQFSAGVAYAW